MRAAICIGHWRNIVNRKRFPCVASEAKILLDEMETYRAPVAEFGFTAHIRAWDEEGQQFKHDASKRARRWVVERMYSWMNRFRRILIHWVKKPENYLVFLHFVCGLVACRAAGLFG